MPHNKQTREKNRYFILAGFASKLRLTVPNCLSCQKDSGTMSSKHLAILFSLSLLNFISAQDTFSIVAVDEESGEIGSAGASCVVGAVDLGGVIIISEIIPGRGAINGQATICIPHVNLNNGIDQMEAGLSPQEILDWLFSNDGCQFGNNQTRQYGIVDFDDEGNARSASFTGTQALDYAGQRVGNNYAIQGNILLGPEILDSMEVAFLNTEGTLAEKLMAAMQGANVPGADSRCLNDSTSSTSAFLQVYRPDDEADTPYLRLNVEETATGVEPIDSLQALFDEFQLATSTNEFIQSVDINLYPNPAGDHFNLLISQRPDAPYSLEILDGSGRLLYRQRITESTTRVNTAFAKENTLLFYRLTDEGGQLIQTGKLLKGNL
ncbi:hypothetical protein CEQ90_08375 [Lewinellaceae bacterium SD302]|nr:hypothetical protein CEQ90_08375 [Lewinellaceae bacterium SD302]